MIKLSFKNNYRRYVGYVGKYKLDFNFLCISKTLQPVLSSVDLQPTYINQRTGDLEGVYKKRDWLEDDICEKPQKFTVLSAGNCYVISHSRYFC